MLRIKCIHPDIIKALSLCGHGSKVLIADGNYPLNEKSGKAEKIFLGLRPGLPTTTEVLETIHSIVNIEKAEVMLPDDDSRPQIFDEFEKELGGMELTCLNRYDFYDACMQDEAVVMAISTGEKRTFSNILITIGVA